MCKFWILDFGFGILHFEKQNWILHKRRILCTPTRVGGLYEHLCMYTHKEIMYAWGAWGCELNRGWYRSFPLQSMMTNWNLIHVISCNFGFMKLQWYIWLMEGPYWSQEILQKRCEEEVEGANLFEWSLWRCCKHVAMRSCHLLTDLAHAMDFSP